MKGSKAALDYVQASLVAWVTFTILGVLLWMLVKSGVKSSQKQKANRQLALHNQAAQEQQIIAHRNRPQAAIKTEINELPSFSVTRWWGSPAPANSAGIEGVAIALDDEQHKLALLEYHRPSDQVITRILNPTDVIEATVEEQGYIHSETTIKTTTTTQTRTSTGSMVGRAIVGGVLLGPAGAVIGGATAKKTGLEKTSGVQNTTQIDVATAVNLKLLVNDTRSPIFLVNFLSHDVAKNTESYRHAVETASYWHGVIGVLKHRATN